MSKTPLMQVRDLAWKDEDPQVRLSALSILTSGVCLIDTENVAGARAQVDKFVNAGCKDDYEFCDAFGPVLTARPGWYHVITCPGAKCAYAPQDWWGSSIAEDIAEALPALAISDAAAEPAKQGESEDA